MDYLTTLLCNGLAKKHNVNALVQDNKISVPLPESIEQTRNAADFWANLFSYQHIADIETPEKIEFVYQKKDKGFQIPYVKNLIKKIDFDVRPKIKYESVKPETFIVYEGSAKITTTQQEWERLNKISKNTETFNALFVMMPENLCYRVNIPLECIIKAEFKDGE